MAPHLIPSPKSSTTTPQAFISGTRKLYDFVDDNPLVQFIDVALVNNSHVISQQPNMTAINSCVEIDLTVRVHPPTHQSSQEASSSYLHLPACAGVVLTL